MWPATAAMTVILKMGVTMDSAHALAVVCRAKQICRENTLVASDELLGYLCHCAEIRGAWSDLLENTVGVTVAESRALEGAARSMLHP